MTGVTVGGKVWTAFDAHAETVDLTAVLAKQRGGAAVSVVADFAKRQLV